MGLTRPSSAPVSTPNSPFNGASFSALKEIGTTAFLPIHQQKQVPGWPIHADQRIFVSAVTRQCTAKQQKDRVELRKSASAPPVTRQCLMAWGGRPPTVSAHNCRGLAPQSRLLNFACEGICQKRPMVAAQARNRRQGSDATRG